MISENELRDSVIAYQNSRNTAAELLKTLKRDVPFETEKDILEAHDRLTEALYQRYREFRAMTINPPVGVLSAVKVDESISPTTETTGAVTPVDNSVSTTATVSVKVLQESEPNVLAMVQKAVDSVSSKEACEELKAKILKATKLSLQDQSALVAKLEAKQKAL